ncbi:MAG TPA: enoyl-CoA hydratase/isomerase family protein [Candidatus Binatus sp.]|uniref:enoyl-CoA hydratase/isomerase family protein n=1 Tax=Candidatus Binatus sp. TaxID=2811406 RepID=UPI002B49ED04|nr:enoyl-CoA hydratase/isomerase family protein [Candidatus Binatus sp.]HKN14694.1 enoyl-CoA hydratase/isomerase family protein [Candidatus Binatus sp.]
MSETSEAMRKETREFKTIRVEVEGPLGRLVLNRPERLNAVNATVLQELAEAARWFDAHRELRVVVVSGAGRAFCAGADLKDSPAGEGFARSGKSWLYRREVGQYGLRAADALEQMRAVTIAQVHGHAVGGGLVLTAVCDLRVAAEDTVFFIPEVDIGLPLAWGGIPRLVREIGPAMTKELVMTCRRFSAAEAKAMGFLNRVVAPSQLESEVNQLAADLIAKPSVPLVVTKDHALTTLS